MIKVMFVCLGNICRSPMAEFMFVAELKRRGIDSKFSVASAATSDEAVGYSTHRGTAKKLASTGIPMWPRYAIQLTSDDYEKYDYFLGMEANNTRDMRYIFGGDPQNKIYRLLDFGKRPRDIADPWYTGNFDRTYEDIKEGIDAFLSKIADEI